jgi:hypothetical protein
MPLSRTASPAIADRITQLIRTLESFRPGPGAGEPLDRARAGLLEALHPGGVKDWYGGDTDITQSALDLPVRAALKDLRRFLLDGSFSSRAVQEREETIVYLEGLLSRIQTPRTEKTPPDPAGAQAFDRQLPETIPYTSPLCAQDLARLLRQSGYARATDDAVQAWLRRYRDNFPDCYERRDRDDRRRTEPLIFYRPEVWPHLVRHFAPATDDN